MLKCISIMNATNQSLPKGFKLEIKIMIQTNIQTKEAKNCYICHNEVFYSIHKIFEVDNTLYFMCRVLNWSAISINIIQIRGQGDWRKMISSDLIEKLAPCLCNSKLFLSKRPNFYFNE